MVFIVRVGFASCRAYKISDPARLFFRGLDFGFPCFFLLSRNRLCALVCGLLLTPSLDEYVQFAHKIREFKDLFFVLMPHPKFLEPNKNMEVQMKLSQIIEAVGASENAWIDTAEDYRNSLVNADFIIVDRSAVMVEVGALGVPVLYISNPEYYEPVTLAIKPLVDSYYQGTSCGDMCNFLQMCVFKNDIMSVARKRAFEECIPFFDGKCGERVKEDMVNGVISDES